MIRCLSLSVFPRHLLLYKGKKKTINFIELQLFQGSFLVTVCKKHNNYCNLARFEGDFKGDQHLSFFISLVKVD